MHVFVVCIGGSNPSSMHSVAGVGSLSVSLNQPAQARAKDEPLHGMNSLFHFIKWVIFFCLGVWPIKLKGSDLKVELSKKRSNAETNSVSVKLYNASGKWKTFHTSVGRKCTSPGQIYVSSHAEQNKQTEPTAAQGRSPMMTDYPANVHFAWLYRLNSKSRNKRLFCFRHLWIINGKMQMVHPFFTVWCMVH